MDSISFSLHAIAELREEEIYLFLEEAKTEAVDFSSDSFTRDQLEKINREDAEKSIAVQTLIHHLLESKKTSDSWVFMIDILNPKGKIVASTSPVRIGLDLSAENYFLRAKENTYLADVSLNSDGVKEFTVSIPVRPRLGPSSTIGVLVNHYNTNLIENVLKGEQALGFDIMTRLRGIGKTGESYLVNKDRLMITDSLFIQDASFRQKADTFPVKECLEKGKEVSGFWRDYRGIPVLGNAMCLKFDSYSWVLVTEQDKAEAIIPIQRLSYLSILGLVAAAALSILVGLFLAGRILKPLVTLNKEIEEISSTKLNLPATKINSGGDEIVSLTSFFRQMARGLVDANEKLKALSIDLEKKSNTDELTGLRNRRYILAEIDRELKRANRYNLKLSGMMIDIDDFKRVNDQHGHQAGDQLLREIAGILGRSIREVDILGRYGGDEFLLLLPETDLAASRVVAERIIKNIRQYSLSIKNTLVAVSVSIGLFSFSANKKITVEDFINCTDQALLQAKLFGKDRMFFEQNAT